MFRVRAKRGLPPCHCHSVNREVIPIFAVRQTVVPTCIDEIDDYIISTMRCSVEEKREIFSTINVDYDKIKKFYHVVTKLERDYNNSADGAQWRDWFKLF
jgi:hypothetical protein